MSTTLKGSLHGLDTKDTYERLRIARKYNYTLKVSGGGKLHFKLKYHRPQELTESGNGEWVVLENTEIDGGFGSDQLAGDFTVPAMLGSGKTTLKFSFSRKALTQGVDYEFFMEPA